MIGAYIGYFVLVALGGSIDPTVPVALLIFLMLAAAMFGSGLLGVAVERFAYRPLRKAQAPRIAPLISALGVSFVLQQLASIFFGTSYKQYNPFGLIRRHIDDAVPRRLARDELDAGVRDPDRRRS